MEDEEDEVNSIFFFFNGRKYASTRVWCKATVERCVVVIRMFFSFILIYVCFLCFFLSRTV